MRCKVLFTATLCSALSLVGFAQAQVPSTGRDTPQSQQQPGAGVGARPGTPTSALPNAAAPRAGSAVNRGPPDAGGATSSEGSGTINRTPNGAIRPGTNMPGGMGSSN